MENEQAFLKNYAFDGGMLQSEEWRHFQEAVGRKTISIEGQGFLGKGVVHSLPIVGNYLYFPRGPVIDFTQAHMQAVAEELHRAAKEVGAKWIRFEPGTEGDLERLRTFVTERIAKAPHDVQPREILSMDITAEEEFLIGQMKTKTRYNIRLAEKKGVKVFATREKKYQEAFLRLISETADRKVMVPHPQSYYRAFFKALPEDMCEIFVAEQDGEVLATNLMIYYGDWAMYLHGGSSEKQREFMATYLLQWRQVQAAKNRGCTRYDFGGVRITTKNGGDDNSWDGITRFKQGFSPHTAQLVFPGSFDIVLSEKSYQMYDRLRLMKRSLMYVKQFAMGTK